MPYSGNHANITGGTETQVPYKFVTIPINLKEEKLWIDKPRTKTHKKLFERAYAVGHISELVINMDNLLSADIPRITGLRTKGLWSHIVSCAAKGLFDSAEGSEIGQIVFSPRANWAVYSEAIGEADRQSLPQEPAQSLVPEFPKQLLQTCSEPLIYHWVSFPESKIGFFCPVTSDIEVLQSWTNVRAQLSESVKYTTYRKLLKKKGVKSKLPIKFSGDPHQMPKPIMNQFPAIGVWRFEMNETAHGIILLFDPSLPKEQVGLCWVLLISIKADQFRRACPTEWELVRPLMVESGIYDRWFFSDTLKQKRQNGKVEEDEPEKTGIRGPLNEAAATDAVDCNGAIAIVEELSGELFGSMTADRIRKLEQAIRLAQDAPPPSRGKKEYLVGNIKRLFETYGLCIELVDEPVESKKYVHLHVNPGGSGEGFIQFRAGSKSLGGFTESKRGSVREKKRIRVVPDPKSPNAAPHAVNSCTENTYR
jgi:hypothetical protein